MQTIIVLSLWGAAFFALAFALSGCAHYSGVTDAIFFYH